MASLGQQAAQAEQVSESVAGGQAVVESVLAVLQVLSSGAEQQSAAVGDLEQLGRSLQLMVTPDAKTDITAGGDVLRTAQGRPETLDPAHCSDQASGNIIHNLYDGLVQFGGDARVMPALAAGWELSADSRTWQFALRKGVRFHNGREVRAEDVKYSLERILNPRVRSPHAWLLEMVDGARDYVAGHAAHVQGIRVNGPHSVTIALEYPYNPFLSNLAYVGAMVVPREAAEGADFARRPVGTGAFKLESSDDQRVVLVANTDYFEGRPFLDRVDVDLAARGDEYADLFRAGQIDSIATTADFLKDPALAQRVELCPSLSVQYIGMNFRRRSLADRRLRQAVNYAIDKERIVATYAGRARAVAGPLPAGVFAHDPDLRGYRYDPAMARRLVAEIGGVKEPLKFHCRSGREAEERAGLISQMINSIGVPCQLVVLPPGEFNRESSMAQADLYMMGWIGDTGDPDNFLQPLFHSRSGSDAGNRGSFRNAEVDRLLDEGQTTTSPVRRSAVYKRLQALLVEEAPWIYLCQTDEGIATQPWVKGDRPHMLAMRRFKDVWISRQGMPLEQAAD